MVQTNRFLCLLLFLSNSLIAKTYVTYDLGGGRFGDHLLAYMHAKWISFQYQLPLLYKPFVYSKELKLDDQELLFEELLSKEKGFSTPGSIRIGHGYETQIPLQEALWICPDFPENLPELREEPQFHFPVDWKNSTFRAELISRIAPKNHTLSLFLPPKDAISIAIHVREGGGYDDWNTCWHAPFKLPPLKFYLDALPKVLNLFLNKKLYIRLFTDAVDAKSIAYTLQQAISFRPDVFIEYQREHTGHDVNVLEDFFSLFHYDVLIRPQSNFSIIPSLLHDFAVVCSPAQYRRIGRTVIITEIDLQVDRVLYEQLLTQQ